MSILKPPSPRLQRGNPLVRGLVGAWLCAEGSGRTAYDISGNGKHGTLVNSPVWIGGHAGSAISLAGVSSQYVSIPPPLAGTTISTFTLALWVNAATWFSFGWSDPVFFRGCFEGSGDGNVYFVVENGGNSYPFCAWGRTGWHHVAMVYDGNQTTGANRIVVYIDAVKQSLTPGGDAITASFAVPASFTLGWAVANNVYMTGVMDDVRVYNRALEANEVSLIYTSPVGLFRPSSAQFLSVISGAQPQWPPASIGPSLHVISTPMRW